MNDKPTVKAESEETHLVCVHCGRELEWCSFCDRSDCSEASCLSCLHSALKESIPPLHRHGG